MEANTFDFEAHLRKVREQTQGVTEVTEDRIALAFAERYGDQFRYYHHHGSWFVWNGQWWAKEETKLAFHYAREIAREHNIMNKASIAKTSTAAGVERHAQADRAFAVTSEKWDRDPFLLGKSARLTFALASCVRLGRRTTSPKPQRSRQHRQTQSRRYGCAFFRMRPAAMPV